MHIKSINDIYIEIKQFQTIGFHHEGSYRIKTMITHVNKQNQSISAFPICSTRSFSNRNTIKYSDGILNPETQSFQSKLFQIKFNEQIIKMNSSCLFRTEIDEENIKDNYLTVNFQLVKYPPVIVAEENPMNSQQNLLKQEMNINNVDQKVTEGEESPSKAKSQKTKTDKKTEKTNKEKKKEKIQKFPKTACQCKLKINLSSNAKQNIHSNFRKIIFSHQQYFSVFYICLTHVKLGYNILPSLLSLNSFHNHEKAKKQKIENIEQTNKTIDQEEILQCLKSSYPSIQEFYDTFITKQTHSLIKFTKQFEIFNDIKPQNLHFSQYNQKKRNQNHQKGNLQKLSDFQSIEEDPNNSIFIKKKDQITVQYLHNFYEAPNIDRLYLIIFMQSKAIQMHLSNIWCQFVDIISSSRFQKYIVNQIIICSQQQINSFNAKRKVQRNVKMDGQNSKNQFKTSRIMVEYRNQPKLKYCHDLYENIPTMQIMQKKTASSIDHISDLDQIGSESTLFVLVHGLHGSQHDMSSIKGHINSLFMTNILVIKTISTKFSSPIETLGKQTAQQIKQYMASKYYVRKINFIGFSLGGLIIRASLEHLAEFHGMFNVFITFSTPHLGISESESCLVRTYTKIVKKLPQNIIIKQLSLEKTPEANHDKKTEIKNDDNKEIQKQKEKKKDQHQQRNNNTVEQIKNNRKQEEVFYLQKLAKDQSLSNFKCTIFVGANQDVYVPLYSATLHYQGNDQKVIKMQNQLWRKLKNCQIVSVRQFSNKQITLMDRLLRRKNHTTFLGDHSFLYTFFSQYYLIL